jgi:hypothetical protein
VRGVMGEAVIPRAQRPLFGALAVSILIAAYTGFRLPNAWTATLQTVSLIDGFHRRFLVGTLLRPLAAATSFDYRVMAGVSFVVLAVLLVTLFVAAMRTGLVSRQLLVVAFFLLPTGGFLFNEVGYFDQILYLLLFAAIALLRRDRVVAAMVVMSLAPLVHEIAIATVIPAFGVAAWQRLPLRRAAALTAVPVAINLLHFALPAASPGAVASLSATLAHANFRFREDALELFVRSRSETRALYDLPDLIHRVRPVALLVVCAFAAFSLTDRVPRARAAWWRLAAACGAIVAPAFLVYGGWDWNRWTFFLVVNFFVMVWLALGERGLRALRPGPVVILATTVLLLARVPIDHFDKQPARELSPRGVRTLAGQVESGKLFAIPSE